MLCQNCNKNEATTHIKQIVNGDMREMHYCRECAGNAGFHDLTGDFGLNLFEFFGGLPSDVLHTIPGKQVKRCPCCGSTFENIVKTGKPGCAECYSTFYDKLFPSLQRIHGRVSHSGKKPVVNTKAPEETNEEKIEKLRLQMTNAVTEENFELAAKIRDEIKDLEGSEE